MAFFQVASDIFTSGIFSYGIFSSGIFPFNPLRVK